MDATTLENLEYPAVLDALSGFCSTPTGRGLALSLRPVPGPERARESYADFSEASALIRAHGPFQLSCVVDITEIIARAEPRGAYLLPEDLLLIKGNIGAGEAARAFLKKNIERDFPRIHSRASAISDSSGLYSEFERVIDERGQIKDDASPELLRIRREVRSARDRARAILDSATKGEAGEEVLQDDIITIRDDRYVLSVKSGKHAEVPGVIHGRSASGATYFIEPFGLVELNNKIAVLKREERAEEIAVLKALTLLVVASSGALLSDLSILTELDLMQAKDRFAQAMGATAPEVRDSGGVSLFSARHPILILKEKDGGQAVVPVDITTGPSGSVLVISGGNTGGKTVALKALGLLTLMVLSGIPVPVADGSVAVAYTSVYADIGDRQNIIESLSTFSAHVKRLTHFLERASGGSLVLIDEIGAGTDPAEGGALALASLGVLKEKGAVVVVTTHLNLLKAHAQTSAGWTNASVEFDESTLRPLYRIRYGLPGPSLGLSIAESLGLPHYLIERARSSVKEGEAAFIASVRKLEEEKEEISRLKERLGELEMKRDAALERLKAGREEMLGKARARVEAMLKEAGEEIAAAARRAREEGKKTSPEAASRAAKEAAKKALYRLGQRVKPYIPSVGDRVVIDGSRTKAVVIGIDAENRRAELQAGPVKVWAQWERLNKAGGKDKIRAAKGGSVDADIEAAASVNLIGMRVEEALPVLTRFLDSAHSSGLDRVEIIHGVGTGRLSAAVDEYLSGCPFVKVFDRSPGSAGGATTVDLK